MDLNLIHPTVIAMERFLHYCGLFLKRKNQKPLYEALQKVKEGIQQGKKDLEVSFQAT
ncbi:unnamed protein product [Lupinus luteus]|uniref:Uncharacterized protein n=1 Tax=Lupinus luteus TaxID=3873 RepID=A0AAV1WVJ2_LUPLU